MGAAHRSELTVVGETALLLPLYLSLTKRLDGVEARLSHRGENLMLVAVHHRRELRSDLGHVAEELLGAQGWEYRVIDEAPDGDFEESVYRGREMLFWRCANLDSQGRPTEEYMVSHDDNRHWFQQYCASAGFEPTVY